ncbi:hypothetical protein OG590_38970 (plasmid) [Streptomyces goshikiensis]|uniref:hypothetical protein n=1 Tax=Streptomyces goshikiensis TaxID=1942 RepID=UPI00386AF157|nr:hypothetical protein OG590_38970 [Streptomyces goshikiensis]
MELHWTWYALAAVGVYRMITVCFEAVVRRTVSIAQQTCSDTAPLMSARHARPATTVQHALTLTPDVNPLIFQADGQGER